MSVYRDPAVRDRTGWSFPEDALPEKPFKNCPACGQNLLAWVCPEGHVERAATHDQKCIGQAWTCKCPTRAGFAVKTCLPERRLRTGWFSRCDGPGIHVHNECNVCGWSGLSRALTDLRVLPTEPNGDPPVKP